MEETFGHEPPAIPGRSRPLRLAPAAPRAIEWTAERLAAGGVVALPTDTVYGLAASLAHPAAISRLFAIKGRDPSKAVAVLLASAADVEAVATEIDPDAIALADRYWPGPLTLVLTARANLPPRVSGRDESGRATVGVRVPNHFLAIEVLAKAGGAAAVTSANRSGAPPALTADDVEASLGEEVDVILDGGRSPGGVASTVVDFDAGRPVVRREGAIPMEHIQATWDEIVAGREAVG